MNSPTLSDAVNFAQSRTGGAEVVRLEPKIITLTDTDSQGNEISRKFEICKMPCTAARKVAKLYLQSNIVEFRDYDKSEEIMEYMLSFVNAVEGPNDEIRVPLATKSQIDNRVPTFEMLVALENEMGKYNFRFWKPGKILDSLKGFLDFVGPSLTEMLTNSLAQSFKAVEQPSTSSEQSIPTKTLGTSGNLSQ